MEIKIKNLKKSFKDNIIIDNINISFEEGKTYGIIGRNGSGKSVLLKIICGFLIPDEGSVEINNIDIYKNDCFIPDARALIEKPSFIDELTGLENLEALAFIQKKVNTATILQYVEMVGLTNDIHKKYSTYSLGMKQKLAIVQVIMENPKIMILDEPFNGLDKKSYQDIIEIFKEIKKKSKIIIIATHIESDISELCDEIYEIDNKTVNYISK